MPPWKKRRILIFARYGLFILLFTLVAALSVMGVRQKWGERTPREKHIESLLFLMKNNEEIPDQYRSLWKKIRPAQIAFERISLDLETRLTVNRRYFDRPYMESMIGQLEECINQNPKIVFHLLGYYALQAKTPIKQAMALIVIRERYPKKYCVYYANRLVHSPNPTLSNLCRDILKDRYQLSSLKRKFRPSYFQVLMNGNE